MIVTKILVVVLLGVTLCKADLEIKALEAGTIEVQTENGKVRGSYGERTTDDKKLLYWFRGIPFAEPPVGDLRFEAPVPKENWSGTLDVRERKPECIQGSDPVRGSEDCLYLSVYTDKKPNKRNKLPVMVWIYGGAFFEGAADFDDHSIDYILDEDIIVVGIHYRVGFLGFFSTGDGQTSANNGIRDQVLALKWVKNNIVNFGGDPEQITIFGQSAGAASVGYLLQIEETKGLFSKAILQSGSTLSPWSLAKYADTLTKDIAKKLKISTSNSKQLLEGLKTVDVEELQSTANSEMSSSLINSNPLQGLALAPVEEPEHENAIITGKSHELISNGKFHQVPLLIGYTSVEARLESIPTLLRLWLAKYDLNPSLLVPSDMNVGAIRRALLGRKIKNQYYDGSVARANEEISRYISDTQFEKPIEEAIVQYSKYTKVYAYHFAYEGALYGIEDRTVPGVGHTEDLAYLFDYGKPGSDADYLTRDRVVRLWTNFAKTGNPTPSQDSLLQNVNWPANEGSSDLKYLKIDKNLKVVDTPNADNINFWRGIYDRYGKPPYTTY